MTTTLEAPSPPAPSASRLRRSVRTVVLAIAVGAAGWLVWWLFFRIVVVSSEDLAIVTRLDAEIDCDNALPAYESSVTQPRPLICWETGDRRFVVYDLEPRAPSVLVGPLSERDPCVRWTEPYERYGGRSWLGPDLVAFEECQPFTTLGGVVLVPEWWYRLSLPDGSVTMAVFLDAADGARFGVGERILITVPSERVESGAVERIPEAGRLAVLLETLRPGDEYQVVKWRLARFHGLDGNWVEFDVSSPARPVTAVYVEPWFADALDAQPSGVIFEADGRQFFVNYESANDVTVLPLGA
jgi:hypothetical protein